MERALSSNKNKNPFVTLYIIILSAGALVTFILNQKIASVLGAASYGDFCVAVNLLWILGVISVLGFDYLVSIEVPRFLDRSVKKGAKFIFELLRITAPIIIIISIVGVALLLLLLASKYVTTLSILKEVHPFVYFIWAIPIFGMYKYLISVIRALGFYALSLALDSLVFSVLMFVSFLFLMHTELNTIGVIFIPVVITLFFLVLLMFGIVFYLKRRHVSVKDLQTHLQVHDKNAISVSMKFLVSNFLSNNVAPLVLLALEIVGRNEECVGYVAACFQCLGVTVFFVFDYLGTVLVPYFSRLLHSNNLANTQKQVTVIHLITAVFAVLACALVYIYTPQLLAGFGAEFVSPAPIQILRVSSLMLAPIFCVYYIDSIIAARKENATLVFVIAIVYCAAVVLVAFPMSYYFAGLGAAIGFIGVQIVYYAFYALLLYKKERLRSI